MRSLRLQENIQFPACGSEYIAEFRLIKFHFPERRSKPLRDYATLAIIEIRTLHVTTVHRLRTAVLPSKRCKLHGKAAETIYVFADIRGIIQFPRNIRVS